jgi:hypothetical protein
MAFRLVAKGVGLKYLLLEILSSFPSPLGGIKAGIEGVTLGSLLLLKHFFNRLLVSSNNKGNRTRLIYDCDDA